MLDAAPLVLPLVMAGVLIASGAGKLIRPDDLANWAELGVPPVFRRTWLVKLHPWGELALALALAVLGGVLGLFAGIASVVLMAAYLWVVVRALRATPDASCSCFGKRRPVTRLTVARNSWLTVVAVATTAVIWMDPLWGGAVAGLWAVDAWGWVVMIAVAVVTALVIMWPDAPAASDVAPATVPAAAVGTEELDYVRQRTPAVPVTLADGTIRNLRDLATTRPQLVLAVSLSCGSCAATIESAPALRARLPELDVRLLVRTAPVAGSFMKLDEPQSLHDTENYVGGSIADWATPTAVLLGVDGMLAGGPVTGAEAIEEFVADVRTALDEAAAVV